MLRENKTGVRMLPSSCLLGVVALAVSAPVFGQDAFDSIRNLEGTIEVTHERQQQEGVLAGCSMTFKAIFRDYTYRGGRPTVLVGNFTLYVMGPNNAFLSLK